MVFSGEYLDGTTMGLSKGSEMMGVWDGEFVRTRDQAGKWFLQLDRVVLDLGFGGHVWAAGLRGRGCGFILGFVWEVGNISVFLM